MKYTDIEKIQKAGLITTEQQRRIVEHFKLKEEGSRFLRIICIVGAVLVAAGVVLLIAANWDNIPRGVKIAAGLLLMLGAHGSGWYWRETKGSYPHTGEALHLLGSALFLANIGLIGQIYHLSSRPPNALLLWWAGIAALPWLLRSIPQLLLSLAAFGVWFGMEINCEGSLIYFGEDQRQILLYALLGLVFTGGAYCLRRTSYAEFASATEKLGLLAFQLFAFPLTWSVFYRRHEMMAPMSQWVFPALAGLVLVLLLVGLPALTELTRQWRWTWGACLAAAIAVLAGELVLAPHLEFGYDRHEAGYHWLASVALFIFSLLQVQVGVQRRSAFLVNLGILSIALIITATYINLFGSMARTGLMFVAGGVVLIGFGIYMEKKRRSLMRKMEAVTL